MNIKSVGFAIGGFVAGAAAATSLFYFGIYRKYIPLKTLEHEIAELELRKHELNKQFESNHKKFINTKRSTDEAIQRMEKELDFYDDQIVATKKEWEAIKASKGYGNPDAVSENIRENEYADDDYPDDDRGDEIDDNPVNIDDNEPDRDNFVISDGIPRWDGPLTDDEQRQYDEANGNESLAQSILMTVKARRWHESIDEDEPSYHISEADHDEAPWFIDTAYLDYYEEDDVLADGSEIVIDPDTIINTIVLNHFGRMSMTSDPNVVWCRNDILETDYNITRHEGSYQHDVLGIPDDEAYKPTRRFSDNTDDEMEEVDDQ